MGNNKRKRPFDKKERVIDVPYFGSESLKESEEFRKFFIKDYGPIWINNLGTKVISKTGKVIHIYRNENGYLQVQGGTTQGSRESVKRWNFTIHRLVATVFIPNPNNLPEVNHKDGNKFNNCVENLEWCTGEENMQHAVKNGLRGDYKGSKNGRHKLNEEQVRDIKIMLRDNKFTHKEIADAYGVSKVTIDCISNGRNWSHVII